MVAEEVNPTHQLSATWRSHTHIVDNLFQAKQPLLRVIMVIFHLGLAKGFMFANVRGHRSHGKVRCRISPDDLLWSLSSRLIVVVVHRQSSMEVEEETSRFRVIWGEWRTNACHPHLVD